MEWKKEMRQSFFFAILISRDVNLSFPIDFDDEMHIRSTGKSFTCANPWKEGKSTCIERGMLLTYWNAIKIARVTSLGCDSTTFLWQRPATCMYMHIWYILIRYTCLCTYFKVDEYEYSLVFRRKHNLPR